MYTEKRLLEMSKKREEALASVQKRLVCLQDSIKLGTEQLDYHSRQSPEALVHFCQEMTHGEVPREASVPTLVVLGQQDPFFVRRSAYEVSRAIPGARTVMVPGSSDLWNLQAPDQFTETVQAWITDAPLPARLVPF
jgi:pimeloyl-ACP methyl ester carboxylesterase